jgi:hypothetical protein
MRDSDGFVLCHHGRPIRCLECGDDYEAELSRDVDGGAVDDAPGETKPADSHALSSLSSLQPDAGEVSPPAKCVYCGGPHPIVCNRCHGMVAYAQPFQGEAHGEASPVVPSGPIVGHKTFSDGHHEPLRQSEAAAIMAASDAAKALRTRRMPDERAAIDAMFEAWQRLKELGWNDAQYCPKDGSLFDVIEPGSTGIHRCRYEGEWPKGSWWIEGDGDLWPSRPVLFRVPAPPSSGATTTEKD